jgi:DNA polymerase-3 subunit chi
MADGACDVWFYHLERTGLDQALPELLDKTLARGWRAVVRSGLADSLESLDAWLWSYRDDSFLPHGLASEPQAARQPILLTASTDNLNGADALFLVHGADPGDLDGYARCLVLFDGKDEDELRLARQQWSALKTGGAALSYWKQSLEGRWEKQA